MVPDIAGIGHSFKGAMSYYLHDKRGSEQEAHLSSSERVAWTETRNLLTENMRTAERIMIATAKDAPRLKREAGIRDTGRKSNAHVYAYSLSWHPSERPTRAEMVRAADETLKVLGADNREAVIVAHTDRAHSHVHIIVNRVDPTDGRMLSTSNDRRKLSEWANRWEREHGKIFTPKREAQRREREQNPDAAQRREYADKARIGAQERAHDRKSRVAALKEFGQAQRGQHKAEAVRLGAANKAARDGIYRDYGARIKDAIARHKAESKPIWQRHYRAQRRNERAFLHREESAPGQLINAWQAAKHQRDTGQLQGVGMFSATMRNFFSNEARYQAFVDAEGMARAQLATRLKEIVDGEVKGIQAERRQSLDQQRTAFQQDRAALNQRQDAERAKLREAWKAIRPDRRPDGSKPYWERRGDGLERREQRAGWQKGSRMQESGEGRAFGQTFEERKAELDKVAGAAETRHQRDEQAQDRLSREKLAGKAQEIQGQHNEAVKGAAEATRNWQADVQASEAHHRQNVSAVEQAQGQRAQRQTDEKAGPDQPFDRKAAYAAVRQEDSAPIDRKAAYVAARDEQAAEGGKVRFGKVRGLSGDRPSEEQQQDAKKVAEQERQRPTRGPEWER